MALAVLAPLSLLASELPRTLAWPTAILVAAAGAVLAWRESRRVPLAIAVAAAGTATVDGRPVGEFRVLWRGPVAFLRWRDEHGRRHARSLWPDVLPPALRRELRLATHERDAVAGRGPMAP